MTQDDWVIIIYTGEQGIISHFTNNGLVSVDITTGKRFGLRLEFRPHDLDVIEYNE